MIPGLDSAYPPSAAQVAEAVTGGVGWWGLYVFGSAALNIWPVGSEQTIKQAGIAPLPICVPRQDFSEDPTAVATATLQACKARGIVSGGVVLDVEYGADYNAYRDFVSIWRPAIQQAGYGPVIYNGPHWNILPPTWEPRDVQVPPPGCAVQNGQTTIGGLSVDTNLAADDFPLGSWQVPDPPTPTKGIPDMITSQLVNGLPQVFYVATDGTVVQLDIVNGKWQYTPISTAAGAPPAAT